MGRRREDYLCSPLWKLGVRNPLQIREEFYLRGLWICSKPFWVSSVSNVREKIDSSKCWKLPWCVSSCLVNWMLCFPCYNIKSWKKCTVKVLLKPGLERCDQVYVPTHCTSLLRYMQYVWRPGFSHVRKWKLLPCEAWELSLLNSRFFLVFYVARKRCKR